ncbi:MAG TPA: hypothetical protein VIY86_03415, partial [Pirellulaceae bacterium]
ALRDHGTQDDWIEAKAAVRLLGSAIADHRPFTRKPKATREQHVPAEPAFMCDSALHDRKETLAMTAHKIIDPLLTGHTLSVNMPNLPGIVPRGIGPDGNFSGLIQ